MKKNVLTALMVAVMLIGLVGYAQDTAKIGSTNSVAIGGAHLGVGVGYRNFHTVRLKGVSQNSFVGIWTNSQTSMAPYSSDSVHHIVSGASHALVIGSKSVPGGIADTAGLLPSGIVGSSASNAAPGRRTDRLGYPGT